MSDKVKALYLYMCNIYSGAAFSILNAYKVKLNESFYLGHRIWIMNECGYVEKMIYTK